MIECPACNSVYPVNDNYLARMGEFIIYRCRSCGMQWREHHPDTLEEVEADAPL